MQTENIRKLYVNTIHMHFRKMQITRRKKKKYINKNEYQQIDEISQRRLLETKKEQNAGHDGKLEKCRSIQDNIFIIN